MPKVTTRSLYPECIANLKLPIDAFYRESRSGVNIAKRNITSGLFGLNKPLLKVYTKETSSTKETLIKFNIIIQVVEGLGSS